jgi:glyoxylase-like metal-dependent hydrolase (beta-lactamase superfamily II)
MIQVLCLPVGQMQANCWLLWDETDRAAVIDPGEEAPRILRSLQERQLTLSAILLTHAHFDHMMAVPLLQEATGAPLMVHEGDAPALADGEKSLTVWTGTSCVLTADRLLQDGDTVQVGNAQLSVLHTPGHTPGSCCYRAGEFLFTGDTLFAGSVGRTDFPGGDFKMLKAGLNRLAGLPDLLQILPGHGGRSTLEYEKKTNPFMVEI